MADEVVKWCGSLLLMTGTPKAEQLQELRAQFPSSLRLPDQAKSLIDTTEALLQLDDSEKADPAETTLAVFDRITKAADLLPLMTKVDARGNIFFSVPCRVAFFVGGPLFRN